MAKIVVGLGASHSPMLSTSPDLWHLHADRDLQMSTRRELLGKDGKYHTYEELLSGADPAMAREITPEKWKARYDVCQQAIARLSETLVEASPDVAVIVGDDQEELFFDDNMPALSLYWGETIVNIQPPAETLSPGMLAGARGYWTEQATEYPGQADLGRHLIESLMAAGFDVAYSRVQKEGVSMSHAFTFVHLRIMNGRIIPVVPMMINTYYPPNQPTMKRCIELGKALRRGIESWAGEQRVAVIASGGLSHFVIDEQLDQTVLSALKTRDEKTLVGVPEAMLQSGNSEAKNWAATAWALEPLEMQLVDYIPCYRSLAGTGCGMGFARWT